MQAENINNDIILDYIEKLKKSNEKINFWYSYLNKKYNADDHVVYLGISLWETLIGSLSVRDCFPPDAQCVRKNGFYYSMLRKTKNLVKTTLCVCINVPNMFLRKIRKHNVSIVFTAFERRQISTFTEAIRILEKKGEHYCVLTTNRPSHKFSKDFRSTDTVECLERYFPATAYGEILLYFLAIRKWLNTVANDERSVLETEQHRELGIVITAIKNEVFKMLFFIKAAQQFFLRVSPQAIIAADNADIRARAVFLVAKKLAIATFHTTYGFIGYDCYEEKYPVAKIKFVFGESQKEILTKNFGLEANTIQVIGCPRFDGLFKIRSTKQLGSNRTERLTILLGSQPSSTNGYSPLSREIKIDRIKNLFSFAAAQRETIRIIIKPHPDETLREVKEIEDMARKFGVVFETVRHIDFKKINKEVDLFVTFISMLALEFMIIGVPVCFLVSVKNMPTLKKACDCGIATEVGPCNDWKTYIEFIKKRDHSKEINNFSFFESEFTHIDGGVSQRLLEVIKKKVDMK
ncbi:MAG: CDP-glycerol glycerophosphotransferase family protein [Candidatus Omnitrophota bacterium]